MSLETTESETGVTELFGEPVADLLVREMRAEAEGVISMRLERPDGGDLPAWEPGAHVDLILPSGLVRQYSLCGDVEDRRSYRLGILKEPESRGGSREIHETGLVGRTLTVRGPRNHFALTDAARFLFIAGGIGVTPILPMLAEAERRGVPWHLVYGGRSRKTMAFLDEIAQRRGGTVDLVPQDELGFPDLDAILKRADAQTDVFTCGPAGMLAAVEERCATYLSPNALHIERFNAGDLPEIDESDNRSFEVELARTGVTITVPPDRSLLRCIRDVIPTILYSCEEGYCGTCETKVLEGVPDHRDTLLSPAEQAENKTMFICVSRSKSPRLVLDL